MSGLLCSLALSLPAVSAAAETGTIVGTVSASGAPLAATKICAIPALGVSTCAETNSEGKYELELAIGTYKVEFTGQVCAGGACKPTYIRQFYDDEETYANAADVAVEEGATTPDIDATMQEGGAIEGTVERAALHPGALAGAEVCAEPGEALPPICTFTNAEGKYVLSGLGAGEYDLDFSGMGYVSQYYDDVEIRSEARPVSVTPPEHVAGIDASLEESAPGEPHDTKAPELSTAGNAKVGSVLQCSEGEWSNNPTKLKYAWLRNGSVIAGHSDSSYTAQTADEGDTITCEVTASNRSASTAATSNGLSVEAKPPSSTPPAPTSATTSATTSSAQPISTALASAIASVGGSAAVQGGVAAAVTLSCPGPGLCKGTLELVTRVSETQTVKRHGKSVKVKVTRSVTLAKATFSAPARTSQQLSLKLTQLGQRLLREAGKKGLVVGIAGSAVKGGDVLLKSSG